MACNQMCEQGRRCTCAPQDNKTETFFCAVAMFAAVFVPIALWMTGVMP